MGEPQFKLTSFSLELLPPLDVRGEAGVSVVSPDYDATHLDDEWTIDMTVHARPG